MTEEETSRPRAFFSKKPISAAAVAAVQELRLP